MVADSARTVHRPRIRAGGVDTARCHRLLADTAAPNALSSLELVWADQGYTGAFAHWLHNTRGWRLEVIRHPERQL